MFGQHPGNMIVDHHHFIDVIVPLGGEHADGGGTATDPHPLFPITVDDRRLAGLHHDFRTVVDRQTYRMAIAELHQAFAGHPALTLRAAGQVIHTAKRQHLRTIFARGDMAHRLPFRPDQRAFRA